MTTSVVATAAHQHFQGHIEWSNMETALFGFDVSKLATPATSEDNINDKKLEQWRRSVSAAAELCRKMREIFEINVSKSLYSIHQTILFCLLFSTDPSSNPIEIL